MIYLILGIIILVGLITAIAGYECRNADGRFIDIWG